jgi:hypothetical protein
VQRQSAAERRTTDFPGNLKLPVIYDTSLITFNVALEIQVPEIGQVFMKRPVFWKKLRSTVVG